MNLTLQPCKNISFTLRGICQFKENIFRDHDETGCLFPILEIGLGQLIPKRIECNRWFATKKVVEKSEKYRTAAAFLQEF